MKAERRALLQFHVAVLLWGFTAILGDLITLNALILVWWRVGLSGLILAIVALFFKKNRSLNKRTVLRFSGIGCLVGLHWLCFYGSIKLANASIALIALSTSAMFTIILEALLGLRRPGLKDFLFALAIIPLMILVVEGLSNEMNIGFGIGILSALLFSVFTICNKEFIHDSSPFVITMIEMISAWLFIGVILILLIICDEEMIWLPGLNDWVYLLILSLACTIAPFVLSLLALKHLSAFTTNFIFNLEPIYGILLAAIILRDFEELTTEFYVGGALIVFLVLLYSLIGKRVKSPSEAENMI